MVSKLRIIWNLALLLKAKGELAEAEAMLRAVLATQQEMIADASTGNART